MRSAPLIAVCAVALAACVSAPPAPIDPVASSRLLESRSLGDPAVTAALSKAGMTAPREWSVDALTVAAWALRPDIANAAADVASGEAAARVAGQLPNPTVSVDPGYLYDNRNGNLSPWSVATAIGFTIETGGKRGIRTAQARAEIDVRRWALADALWRARQEVRRGVLAVQLARQSLALAEDEARLRQAFSDWVANQFRFGAVAQPDRLAAQTNLAQAQASLRTARGASEAARADLAAAVGLTGEKLPLAQISGVATNALPTPQSENAANLRDWGVVNRLSVNRALAEYSIAEQGLRLAVAKQYPDITFGPGYIYDKADQGVTLSLGMTLPLFHGEQAAIDDALATRKKAATQFETVQAQALAEIDGGLIRYTAAYAALTDAKAAVADAGRSAAAVERRLQLGGADRGEALTAQLTALVTQRATLDAEKAALDALGTLEDGVQRPVWPASSLTMQRPDSPAE